MHILLILWLLIGALTFWYVVTKIDEHDITLQDLPLWICVSMTGLIGFLYTLYIMNEDKIDNIVLVKGKNK